VNIYLVLVLLIMPGKDAPQQELQRQMISASSDGVCQQHADKLANGQRASNANFLRASGAMIVGRCINKGVMP